MEIRDRHAATILKNRPLNVLLMVLKTGAKLHEHHTKGPIALQVVSGAIRCRGGTEECLISAGEMIGLDRNVSHSVEAGKCDRSRSCDRLIGEIILIREIIGFTEIGHFYKQDRLLLPMDDPARSQLGNFWFAVSQLAHHALTMLARIRAVPQPTGSTRKIYDGAMAEVFPKTRTFYFNRHLVGYRLRMLLKKGPYVDISPDTGHTRGR